MLSICNVRNTSFRARPVLDRSSYLRILCPRTQTLEDQRCKNCTCPMQIVKVQAAHSVPGTFDGKKKCRFEEFAISQPRMAANWITALQRRCQHTKQKDQASVSQQRGHSNMPHGQNAVRAGVGCLAVENGVKRDMLQCCTFEG